MKNLKLFAVFALAGLAAHQANAQEETLSYPYNFVGAQAGIQLTATDYDALELVTPIVGLQAGRWFAPQFGGRVSFQGWNTRGGLNSINETYKYKYLTSDLDLLFNVGHIFGQDIYSKWNYILVAGVGLNYAWDNDELIAPLTSGNGVAYTEKNVEPWKDDRFSHNFRVGAMIDYRVSQHWSVNLEIDANNLGDRFNSKVNGHCDWQPTAALGVNYIWGKKTAKVAKPAPVVEEKPAPAPAVVEQPAPAVEEEKPAPVVEKPAPVVEKPVAPKVEEPEPSLDFFYDINITNISAEDDAALKKFAQWVKDHEGRKVVVKGYADKGTGNAEINKGLSEKRAENVKNLLIKKYGIAASVIETSAYGDTVQPFAENDKNRCSRLTIK